MDVMTMSLVVLLLLWLIVRYCDAMMELEEMLMGILTSNEKMIISVKEQDEFDNADVCYICEKGDFTDDNCK
eukprot:4115137-Heterocapsa_arctica.AAC.1